jgi:endonuclease/exonuclease/phosphatase family metal-dependent hydrolase
VLVTRIVDDLEPPSLRERQAVLNGPVTQAAFLAALARMPALRAIEAREPPRQAPPFRQARIVFWNAERLKYFSASAALLESLNADALLLCEVDVGMARTENRHTIGELADELAAGYVFGAEFVELGLGDLREQKSFAGKTNRAGLHGAGLLSRVRLLRPALVRLETSGRWFDGAFHERRVGGRIAMLASIEIAGRPVLLASVHYESHTGPADRLLQTRVLLDCIEEHAPGQPVLIGGDFNTSTFELEEKQNRDSIDRALAADPKRLVAPQSYEPMFELLRRQGYDWNRCNVALAPTQRARPDGTPAPPFGKIDWLFSRGLVCTDPVVVPAVDAQGVAISDHEALCVTVAPV